MKKQTVLITGANKGIGFEAARQLAQAGYHVFLGSRNQDLGRQAVATLKAEGLNDVTFVPLDVTREESVQQAHKLVAQQAGSLDVLINNAGILGDYTQQQPSNTPHDNVYSVFETNYFGVVRMVRVFIDLLRKAPVPRIVNVTSDLASLTLHNDPSWVYYTYKGAAYGPSKTALNAYTVALAYDLRNEPFKVNMVNPGHTATDFNHHTGTKNVVDSARLVAQYAQLDANGPTGKYISDYGESPW
jgi:NAD(P)-dependent dehydrogenase (short-subunit alcohol dehydrogenase family)